MSKARTRRAPGRHGAGDRLPGPTLATRRIHQWIADHPGCTEDELFQAVLENDMIARSAAYRDYAQALNRHRRVKVTPHDIAVRHAEAAVRTAMKVCLYSMVRWKSIQVRYYDVRPLEIPHAEMTDAQMLSRPEDSRQHVLEMEALRAVRLEYAKLAAPWGFVSWEARVALQSWTAFAAPKNDAPERNAALAALAIDAAMTLPRARLSRTTRALLKAWVDAREKR